jgi:hypothetical protein
MVWLESCIPPVPITPSTDLKTSSAVSCATPCLRTMPRSKGVSSAQLSWVDDALRQCAGATIVEMMRTMAATVRRRTEENVGVRIITKDAHRVGVAAGIVPHQRLGFRGLGNRSKVAPLEPTRTQLA